LSSDGESLYANSICVDTRAYIRNPIIRPKKSLWRLSFPVRKEKTHAVPPAVNRSISRKVMIIFY